MLNGFRRTVEVVHSYRGSVPGIRNLEPAFRKNNIVYDRMDAAMLFEEDSATHMCSMLQ